MKKLILTLVCALVVFGLTTSNAHAVPLVDILATPVSGETDLWKVYSLYFSAAQGTYSEAYLEGKENNAATLNGLYTAANGKITPYWRDAGNSLTLYSYDPTTQIDGVLAGGKGPIVIDPPTYDVPAAPTVFGLKAVNAGGTWYTEPSKNPGGLMQWVVFDAPPEYSNQNMKLIALEDTDTGDHDYNDFVFAIENFVPTNEIPEPTSMMLLGMGILGLFGFKKRIA